ncbi:hypothetical protein RB213_001104 [Colletotrichum asianum]
MLQYSFETSILQFNPAVSPLAQGSKYIQVWSGILFRHPPPCHGGISVWWKTSLRPFRCRRLLPALLTTTLELCHFTRLEKFAFTGQPIFLVCKIDEWSRWCTLCRGCADDLRSVWPVRATFELIANKKPRSFSLQFGHTMTPLLSVLTD